jgi:acyl dehydratase/nitroreductase
MSAFRAITRRQGVFAYLPRPVEKANIDRVLTAAIAAPSPANSQPWSFIVVTDPALTVTVARYLMRTQQEHVFGRLLQVPGEFGDHLMRLYHRLDQAPCFVVLCRHRRADLAPPELSDTVRDWELCSLGAAMANLMAAATELGLGTRWFGNPMLNPEPLHNLLGIPGTLEVVAVTPLGYHEEPAKDRPEQPLPAQVGFRRGDKHKLAALLQGRLPLGQVVHLNQYGAGPAARNELKVGQVFEARFTLSQRDFVRFAQLSGDDNPIHVDASFAAKTRFGRPVAHGMFLYGLTCGLLPGGSVPVDQELMFPNATPVGDEITVRAEIIGLDASRGTAELSTRTLRQDGNPGLEGRTTIWLPGARRDHVQADPVLQSLAAGDQPTLRGLAVGQRYVLRRTFVPEDLAEYADLCSDANPIFADMGNAEFQGARVPGALLGGLFSHILGTKLPGPGTNYLKQSLRFPAPAYVGEELHVTVEVVRIRPEKQLVNLRTTCTNPEGGVVCDGEALVLVVDVIGDHQVVS